MRSDDGCKLVFQSELWSWNKFRLLYMQHDVERLVVDYRCQYPQEESLRELCKMYFSTEEYAVYMCRLPDRQTPASVTWKGLELEIHNKESECQTRTII